VDDLRKRLGSCSPAATPAARLVQPEEVAEAVAFLSRREAGAMTGQAIAVACGEV
jgi:3-hydroxybutyrate dehydrogenase